MSSVPFSLRTHRPSFDSFLLTMPDGYTPLPAVHPIPLQLVHRLARKIPIRFCQCSHMTYPSHRTARYHLTYSKGARYLRLRSFLKSWVRNADS